MKIKKVSLNNFRSFGSLEIELKDVNIFVGANASGKTNFFKAFEFLRNIKRNGIKKAVGDLGGFDDLKNFNLQKNIVLIRIEIEDGDRKQYSTNAEGSQILKVRDSIIYEIQIIGKNHDFDIREELQFCEHFEESFNNGNESNLLSDPLIYSIKNTFGKFEIPSNERIVKTYKLSNGGEAKIAIGTPFHRNFLTELENNYKSKSLLEYPGVFIPSELFDFGIYSFDPQMAKGFKSNSNTIDLDENGENLALIVQGILKDPNKNETFITDVSGILDFVNNIKTHQFENTVDLRISENNSQVYTKSALLSDGTISVIAMVVALYYQRHSILFFEEPERGIHPSLIANILEVIYDVATELDRQVIISTHSPEFLRVNGAKRIENLFLVEKVEGNSTIIKPGKAPKSIVSAFLENGLGLDTLFIQNLLDA
jgi:predicted ATPase